MKREIVIGDIHGCYDELTELLTLLKVTPHDLIISPGDIVDRGEKSVEVYEFFRNTPNTKVLMGNHERKHVQQEVFTYAQDIVKIQFKEKYPEFLEWASQLDYYYESTHAIIVHAALETGVSLQNQREDVLSGSTAGEKYLTGIYGGEYWTEKYTGEKPVIFGHHVVGDQPKVIRNKIYGLDTGACHGGYLTALVLPDFTLYQVKAKKDYWEDQKKKFQLDVLKAKPWSTREWNKIEKEIQKFEKKEDNAVQLFLQQLREDIQHSQALFSAVLQQIEFQKEQLLDVYGEENFNQKAAVYSYKNFLFLSKKGNLTKEHLYKSLNTPQKVIDLAQKLSISVNQLFDFST